MSAAGSSCYNTRLIEEGGRIVLVPTIRSSYYPRRTFKALAKQYWEYGAAKGTLYGRGRPLQPRHFVPSAMVAGGPALWLLGRFSGKPRGLLRALSLAYVVAGGTLAKRAADKNGANPGLTFAAMATMHVTYGAGFIYGACKEKFEGSADQA